MVFMRNGLETRNGALGPLLVVVLVLCVGWLRHPASAAAFADKKAEGAELFATRGCAHCHGSDGQGTERAPALRELRKKLSAEKITDQIVHGGGNMPAFGDSLKPEEVTDLVAFLRAKNWVTPPQPSLSPSSTPPAAAAQ